MPTIRPQVIDLLMRIDGLDLGPANWTIDDGRPLTYEERKLALSATRDEVQAMLDLSQAKVETAAAEVDAGAELIELLDSYWQAPGDTVEQVVGRMPADQQARAEELLRGMPAQITVPWTEVPRRRDDAQ
jgi:hypothetical protein